MWRGVHTRTSGTGLGLGKKAVLPGSNSLPQGREQINHRIFQRRTGAGDRTRTYDPIITNDVLYQLSYTGAALGYSCMKNARQEETGPRKHKCFAAYDPAPTQ